MKKKKMTSEKNIWNKRRIFFAINSNLVIIIGVAAVLLIPLWIGIKKSYFDSALLHQTSVIINFVLSLAIVLLMIFMVYTLRIHQTENFAKTHALKIINRISRVKLMAFNVHDLMDMICKKLEEELGGRFFLVLADDNFEAKLNKVYAEKARKSLNNITSITFHHESKVVYFQPVAVVDKKIGVMIAEVDTHNDFNFTVREILSNQIAIVLNTFKVRKRLSEAKVTQEREKLRSLILSSISHDLKTPLSSIIGSLAIFKNLSEQNKLDEESGKDLISTALEEAERLKSFIDDVLEMTRLESGALKLQKELLSPLDLVERTLKRFEEALKNYELEINLSEKVRINFDPTSGEQVIQNLIDNTIKYSPKNTKISIWDKLENGLYYVFLKDEGRGIKPEKLDLIFNKFERFALEDKVVGSGLGLSIVKALMEANNATIIAKNAEGEKGAIFVLGFREFKIINN